jgi:hypothetical protein
MSGYFSSFAANHQSNLMMLMTVFANGEVTHGQVAVFPGEVEVLLPVIGLEWIKGNLPVAPAVSGCFFALVVKPGYHGGIWSGGSFK